MMKFRVFWSKFRHFLTKNVTPVCLYLDFAQKKCQIWRSVFEPIAVRAKLTKKIVFFVHLSISPAGLFLRFFCVHNFRHESWRAHRQNIFARSGLKCTHFLRNFSKIQFSGYIQNMKLSKIGLKTYGRHIFCVFFH